MIRVLGVTLLCATATACDSLFPYSCTLSIEPAVVVEIDHAHTGAPLADSATGVVIEGSYSDSLRPYGFNARMVSRKAADERPGRYTVFVSRPGFQN